jgi:hypothetical protein
MKSKILNFLLIITSLGGYLEWGGGNNSFLFEAEGELLSKMFTDPASVIHPFTVIPLFGQLVLIFTLFQSRTSKLLTFVGIGCISVLLGLMFMIGLWDLNFKIFFSTVPFIVLAAITILHFRKID